jgi:hypothetical protein
VIPPNDISGRGEVPGVVTSSMGSAVTTSTTSPLSASTVSAIHGRLKASVLSPAVALNTDGHYANGDGQRTYVENTYPAINLSKIAKAPESVLRVHGKTDPAPGEYLLGADDFAAKAKKDPTLARVADKSQAERRRLWLDAAKAVADRPVLLGFCNLFAMVSVVLLVSEESPLGGEVPVEWVGSGRGFDGHMTAVVNREPDSDIARPDTWGGNYVIVDYWYGLQRKAGPIFLPRRKEDIARKLESERDQHDVYRLFFDEQGTPRSYGSFAPKSYQGLRVKAKSEGTF